MDLAHGPDTEELLRRIANMNQGWLNVNGLNITSLPPLPADIKVLWCRNTQLTSIPPLPPGFEALNCNGTQIAALPELPSTLEGLSCANTNITSLPETLPPNLEELYCSDTQIAVLPELPSKLKYLCVDNTQITVLPELPAELKGLRCQNTPLIIQREGEKYTEYNDKWRAWKEEQVSKKRCRERCSMLKEDLMAAAWHPSRMEKWLTNGGWDFVEGL